MAVFERNPYLLAEATDILEKLATQFGEQIRSHNPELAKRLARFLNLAPIGRKVPTEILSSEKR